jgi:hypothetical protein
MYCAEKKAGLWKWILTVIVSPWAELATSLSLTFLSYKRHLLFRVGKIK